MIRNLKPSRQTDKAIAGALVALSVAVPVVLSDGAFGWLDLAYVVGAAAAGYLGIYVAPANKPRAPVRRRRR